MALSMICGAVYEYEDRKGNVNQGTLVSIQRAKHGGGVRVGTFLFSGLTPEILAEDDVQFQRMKLIGRPASPKIGRPKKE